MSISAMKQALEALENVHVFVTTKEKIKHPEGTDWYEEAITALRQAIAEAEKQEPVFYVIQATDRFGEGYEQTYWEDPNGFPVYAAPVHAIEMSEKNVRVSDKWVEMQCQCGHKMYAKYTGREWVGLTDDEVFNIYKQFDTLQYKSFAKAIEAKLKEKNNG